MCLNNFKILLLCCIWISFGEGKFINSNNSESSFTSVKVIQTDYANIIYANEKEYVRASINVESQTDSTCEIQSSISNMASRLDLFTKIDGICGYRAVAEKVSGIEWQIKLKTPLQHDFIGRFTVLTIDGITTSNLQFYFGESAIIPLDSYDRKFCKISSHFIDKEIKISEKEYEIPEQFQHNSVWRVDYYNDNNVPINSKHFNITFTDKPHVVTSMNYNKISANNILLELQCTVVFKTISQCSFKAPSGKIIDHVTASKDHRFDLEIINAGAPGVVNSICKLTVQNSTKDDKGEWQCSIHNFDSSANDIINTSEKPRIPTIEVYQKIGAEFNMNCTDNNDWKKCNVKGPDGIDYSESFNPLPKSHGPLKLSNLDGNNIKNNNDDQVCSIKIPSANKILNGNWTCSVTNENKEFTKIFSVQVAEDYALGNFKYELDAESYFSWNQTILEARPFPTNENKMKNITNCQWRPPFEENYLNDRSSYVMTNDNNVCRLVMKYTQKRDKGRWVCIITLESSNGAWDSYSAIINVKEVAVHEMFWWDILFTVVVCIIAVAIFFIVRWDITNKKNTAVLNTESRRFKEYDYEGWKRTKKVTSNDTHSIDSA